MQKHLVIIIWDLDYGGIQTRLLDILKRIPQKYPKTKITLLMKRKYPNRYKIDVKHDLSIRYYSDRLYKGEQFLFAYWLMKQLWQVQPTHLLTFSDRFSCLAVFYKSLKKCVGSSIRVTISEEIFLSQYLAQYEKWYWTWLIRFFYRGADQILVLTQAMKTDLLHQFYLSDHQIAVIPSWLLLKPSLNTHKKSIDLLFIGRVAAEKRVEWLISLAFFARKLKQNICIAVVGDGPKLRVLKEIVRRGGLGEMIQFYGYQSPAHVQNFIQKSFLLGLPSKNEGTPMVILEAANQGVPAVVANFPGANEVILQNKTGIIAKTRQIFINEVLNLLNNKTEIKRIGRVAQQRTKSDFSIKNLDRFIELVLA